LLLHLIVLTDKHIHTHTHTHTVGFHLMRDRPVSETCTWQHTTFTRDIHPLPRRVRPGNLSKRATTDPCLRPRGHWVRPNLQFVLN